MTRRALGLLLLPLAACKLGDGWQLRPAVPIGPPLRIADRLYLLTTQSHLHFGTPDDPDIERIIERRLFIDLWAFDANTIAPLWRKRLHSSAGESFPQTTILGAEADTLWIFLPEGLVAASAATGNLIAVPASLEAANAQLKGVLPKQRSSFHFGANGLNLQAADGRYWSLHPRTFTVQPANTPSPNAILPAYRSANAVRSYQARGLDIPGRWLGLLDDSEAATLRDKNLMYPDLDRPARRKLWGARVKNGIFTDLSPLTAEFLAPGLFGGNRHALLLHNPDGVLIFHQDRLDDAGRFQLARIAGPAGNIVWNAPLPFTAFESALPGASSLVLLGVQATQPKGPHHLLTAIQLANGNQQTYDLTLLDRNPEATPATRP